MKMLCSNVVARYYSNNLVSRRNNLTGHSSESPIVKRNILEYPEVSGMKNVTSVLMVNSLNFFGTKNPGVPIIN